MPEQTDAERQAALAESVRLVLANQASAGDRERVLLGDLRSSRIKLKRANETIDELKAKVPTDGALVIPKDDAAGLDLATIKAFKALNLPPDKLKERLAVADGADADKAETARVQSIVDVAEPAGFNGRVLAAFAKTLGFTLATKDETVNGEKKQVPVAQKLGADGQGEGEALPLEAFVKQHLPNVPIETLKLAGDGKGAPANPPRQAPPVRQAGAQFHSQSGAGTPGGGDKKGARLEEMRADPAYAAF